MISCTHNVVLKGESVDLWWRERQKERAHENNHIHRCLSVTVGCLCAAVSKSLLASTCSSDMQYVQSLLSSPPWLICTGWLNVLSSPEISQLISLDSTERNARPLSLSFLMSSTLSLPAVWTGINSISKLVCTGRLFINVCCVFLMHSSVVCFVLWLLKLVALERCFGNKLCLTRYS